ncbi:hypothetical protein RIF29_29641 [Crotalaria pallida]|uniref:Uncharacterized protein n=1 Tax=Crotalaria pallida TaxID=3830 RepID=A0AAN9ELQ2_CROPI
MWHEKIWQLSVVGIIWFACGSRKAFWSKLGYRTSQRVTEFAFGKWFFRIGVSACPNRGWVSVRKDAGRPSFVPHTNSNNDIKDEWFKVVCKPGERFFFESEDGNLNLCPGLTGHTNSIVRQPRDMYALSFHTLTNKERAPIGFIDDQAVAMAIISRSPKKSPHTIHKKIFDFFSK